MTEVNPYQPPAADLERGIPEPEGPRLPWEDPAAPGGLPGRALATLAVLLRPAAAGPALGAGRRLGPAVTFYTLVGLPLTWLAQVLVALLRPGAPPPWMPLLGVPTPPLAPEAAGFQRMVALAGALATPISLAIGLAVAGAVCHLGLWMVRGLNPGRGFPATYRTTLYLYGGAGLVSGVLGLWPLLPPWPSLALFLLTLAFWLAVTVHQGLLLARAHATATWRGLLGVFLPWILVVCCCGGLGAALAVATGAFRGPR